MSDKSISTLKKIEAWFHSQCDGDWEHTWGINLETLDNPGWGVDIDLSETTLEETTYEFLKIERTEHDWLHCSVSDGKFRIRCGVFNLEESFEKFLQFAGL